MLERLLLFILISPIYFIIYHILGKLLYKFNKSKKIGHYLVSMSIAEDFGMGKKTRKWLYDNCPYDHNCNNCKIWTCGNYSNKANNNIDNTNPH